MDETVTCSKSVLLKLKTMSESTHKTRYKMAERNRAYHMHINISLIKDNKSMARTTCLKR